MAEDALTALQREALGLFFDLPESTGFILAGGAALIASGLSSRPTNDIDLFAAGPIESITTSADAFEAACRRRGWTIERIRDSPTFRRLVVHTEDAQLLVDLAIDSPPLGPPTITAYGPTYPPLELAARKVLALYDRAAARDFVDLHTLAGHFDVDELIELARDSSTKASRHPSLPRCSPPSTATATTSSRPRSRARFASNVHPTMARPADDAPAMTEAGCSHRCSHRPRSTRDDSERT